MKARYRLIKAGDTIAYLGLLWFSWRFLDGELHWRLAIGAVVLAVATVLAAVLLRRGVRRGAQPAAPAH